MRKRTLLPLIALLALLLGLPASAQDTTSLEWLDIKLWPEYDDPRLLVIIDGQVTEPGQTVRIPVPVGATINAVASTGDDGGLMDNAWQSVAGADGSTLVTLVPSAPMFRVEYYIPLTTDGNERLINFVLPAGFFETETASIEMLVPPDSENVDSQPVADMSDIGENGTQLMLRTFGPVTGTESIVQSLTYENPTGAMAMSEDAGPPATAIQPSAQTVATADSGSDIDYLLIGLVVLAVLLVGAGAFGLWRTRKTESEPAPAARQRPPKQKKKQQTEAVGLTQSARDRFCRKCGTEFKPEDRFCRNCGAKRV